MFIGRFYINIDIIHNHILTEYTILFTWTCLATYFKRYQQCHDAIID